MSWQQTVTPNLDPYVYNGKTLLTDWYGWCLATVETAFSAPRLYANAWAAWQANGTKHQDRNFPVGVYFPIWFSGYSGLGHVAFAYVNTAGQMNIWTSPYTHVPYFYTGYHSVDALAAAYHVTYVGWSEDISGKRVISNVATGGDEMIANDTQAHQAYQLLRPNGDGSPAEIAATSGKRTWAGFANDAQAEMKLRNQNIANFSSTIATLQGQVTDLTSQVTSLSARPTAADLQKAKDAAVALQGEVDKAQANAKAANDQLASLQAEKAADTTAADTFLRRLGQFIAKYLPGGK